MVFGSGSIGIACPTINGKFECIENNSGNKYKFVVQTFLENNIFKYGLLTPQGYVTERSDNKVYHHESANGKTNVDSKGYCESETFIYESEWIDPEIKPPKNPKVKLKKSISLDSKGNLIQLNLYSNLAPVKIFCKKLN